MNQPVLRCWMIGVSPTFGPSPSAAFCRSRCNSFCGSTCACWTSGLRQYSTLSMKLSSLSPGARPGQSCGGCRWVPPDRPPGSARPDRRWRCSRAGSRPTAAPVLPRPAAARFAPAAARRPAAAGAGCNPAASTAARASSPCIRPAHPGSGQRCATACRRCSRPAGPGRYRAEAQPVRRGLGEMVRMRRSILIHLPVPQVCIRLLMSA